MINKIEELGKILIEIDGIEMRLEELSKIKENLKFAINLDREEQREEQVNTQVQE